MCSIVAKVTKFLNFQQKLVAGDDTGTLSCYEFKKGEPVVRISISKHLYLLRLCNIWL